MPKAEKDGIYRFRNTNITVRKGDVVPDGAEPIDAPQERKKGPAPENRAEPGTTETRKKKSDS